MAKKSAGKEQGKNKKPSLRVKSQPLTRPRAASIVERLVLPTSVTRASPSTASASSARILLFVSTGAASTIRSDPEAMARSSPPTSAAPMGIAFSITSFRSTATTIDRGQRARTARPSDPPIRPQPMIATCGKIGGASPAMGSVVIGLSTYD